MFIVLLSSAVLVILPVFLVQYQRFLASLPRTDTNDRPRTLPAPQQLACKRGKANFDGTASDTASEDPSEPRPGRTAIITGYERRESRKPWEAPFPMRSGSVREPYLYLPRVEEGEYDTKGEGKGKERERRSMSPTPPNEEEKDEVLNVGHLPVTDLPSNNPPTLATMHSLLRQPQSTGQPKVEVPTSPTESASRSVSGTTQRGWSPSLVQTIALILAFIIFIFCFAILVAHCMAWFVVYKTEVRLGEVRKGLLRGGDMRVCLCGR